MQDNRNVAIFWDYENCSPPLSSQGYAIVDGIRRIAHVFGSVTVFKTYLDMAAQSRNSVNFRSELQSSGVSILDCPHNGRKDVVDKMILVDMLAFAIDHKPPATVILIAGDRDYAYALSTLRLRKYSVILIVPSPNASQSLQSQASVVIDWNYAILGKRHEANTPPLRQFYRDLDEATIKQLEDEIQHPNEDPAVTLMFTSHPATEAPTHTRWGSAAEPLEPSAFQRSTGSNDTFPPAPSHVPDTPLTAFLGTPRRSRHNFGVSRARSTTRSTQVVPDFDRDLGSPFVENNALSDGSAADEYVSTANGISNAPQYSFARPSTMSPGLECYQNMAGPSSPPSVNSPASPSPSAVYSLGSRTIPLPSLSHTCTISGGTPVSYGSSPQKGASAAIPSSPASTGGRSEISSAPKSVNNDSVASMMDDAVLLSDPETVRRILGIDDDDDDNFSNESPVLVEVDDSLYAYPTNAVEPCFNESQTSFVDSMGSFPANDTSPFTEPYGTPMSRMSSLSPIPGPSVTVPNVEMGPPQAMSVISDNSSDHSLEPQLPPVESLEDKIRRLTPPHFLTLINLLLLDRSKGINKSSRSSIAMKLVQHDRDIYMLAGVSRFGQYVALAERASLVLLGPHGLDGQPWIGLHPNLFRGETVPQSPTPSSTYSISSSSGPQGSIKSQASLTTTTPPPSFVPQATMPNPSTPPPSIAPQATMPNPTTPPPSIAPQATISNPTTPPPANMSVEPIPFCFYPLVTCLVNVQKGGRLRPLRSSIGLILGSSVYAMAGVSSLKEYLALAVEANVVELGGVDGHAWVMVHPDVLSGRRSF